MRRGDQASRLRQLVAGDRSAEAPKRASCHVITVISGKGGVGKTFIATNLSIAMAARGHRVILFDMDMGLANADIVLGVQARGTWSEVLKGRRRLGDVVIEAPGGVAFAPGSSGIAELADLSEFERHQLMAAMQEIEARYDVVILDCGAGISRNVLGFAATADTVLVVTTPEPTSLTDAYAMIKVFPHLSRTRPTPADEPGGIGLLVNNVASRREGRDVYERISGVAARFLQLAVMDCGYILRDEHVPAAIRERYPLILRYPRCVAASCLMALASRLSREIGQPQAEQSLFARVVNMFL
ncbi:MAG: MinD/ParA family protein [Planctomycetes bacterium]|nr:MinD/ParA family protein [Planctomycetota bacterium]